MWAHEGTPGGLPALPHGIRANYINSRQSMNHTPGSSTQSIFFKNVDVFIGEFRKKGFLHKNFQVCVKKTLDSEILELTQVYNFFKTLILNPIFSAC
jgi:hypothetical protein